MTTNASKDRANAVAAQQEAESRRLIRKQGFQKNSKNSDEDAESPGVKFEEESSSIVETSKEDFSVETSSKVPLAALEGDTREIKIITDGTYKNTQVFINSKVISFSEMTILVSKEKNVQINFMQKVSLFGE